MPRKLIFQLDWISILIFLCLVGLGWMNIFSTTLAEEEPNLLDTSKYYGKQLTYILLSLFLIVLVLSIEAKFYQRFASIIYVLAVLSLVGLLFFGKTIAGQTAWYSFGSFSIQPAEFVKPAVALAIAKYLTGINVSLKNFSDQVKTLLLMGIPVGLIMLQPDAGSAMIYAAFIIPLYREGLPDFYLIIGFLVVALFVSTLGFGSLIVAIAVVLITVLLWYFRRNKKTSIWTYILISSACVVFTFSVNFIFENVLLPHQKERLEIILGKEVDRSGAGYNTYHSKVAIGSGGWTGKGWLEGTQTRGRYVPEQHTDYIFSAVGEEFGFLGSAIVVLLFSALLFRLFFLAERQKSAFNRIYGYGVVSILFLHFFVNIAMVLGLFPTVGIPLPFFSYGGSGLCGFTLLIFIFLKLDATRKE